MEMTENCETQMSKKKFFKSEGLKQNFNYSLRANSFVDFPVFVAVNPVLILIFLLVKS